MKTLLLTWKGKQVFEEEGDRETLVEIIKFLDKELEDKGRGLNITH